jgi:hypothetical protein
MRVLRVVAIIAAVLAGCATAGEATQAGPADAPEAPPAADAPRDLPLDEPPEREGPGLPTEVVDLQEYGDRHRDAFGGMFVDPPGGRQVVMLFTVDLETHARAVNDILPGTRVERARFTWRELVALAGSFDPKAFEKQGIEYLSAGVDTTGNRVALEVKSNDPTLELRLEATHGGMLDVTVHPLPGPWRNVESGDGWRLIANGRAAATEAYVVRAATDPASWDELWTAVGIGRDQPHADLTSDVVVSFGHGIGGCPELRLDDVVIRDGVVLSRTSDPLAPRGCEDMLSGAVAFVVAIERDALPKDGFVLRLCADCAFAEELMVRLP